MCSVAQVRARGSFDSFVAPIFCPQMPSFVNLSYPGTMMGNEVHVQLLHGVCDDFFCGKGLLFRSCIRRIWELLLEGAPVGFGQQRVAAMACAASGACESGR